MIIGISIFTLGLIFGSFFNVCIWRIPKGKSIVFPSSSCPNCSKPIKFYDNIPILSYIMLMGKCRNCKSKISVRYPIVELLTALLFLFGYIHYGAEFFDLGIYLFLVSVFIILSFIDFDTQTLPDRFTLGLIPIGLITSIFRSDITIFQSIIGVLSGGIILLLIAVIGSWVLKKEAMGGGDIKLMAGIGGFVGLSGILLTIFLASFLGAIYGILNIIFTKDDKDAANIIPWGPFICLAAMIVHLYSDTIIEWYLSLFI